MHLSTQRKRGSLLIVAMIFAAVIAISLGSYLRMATNALRMSQRAFLANEAVNLAETGLEIAVVAINSNSWGSPWTKDGSNATGVFSGFGYEQGANGTVKVWVKDYLTSNPTVVAKATITPSQGPAVEKMILISGFIQRSLFSRGLVGIHGLTFQGNNPSVDSWNSLLNDDGTPRMSPVDYSSTVAHDKGSIAAVEVSATASVNNADIWGTASVGSSSTGAVSVGPNGRVGPYGTAGGVKNPAYISTNFTANIQTVETPAPSLSQTNIIASAISNDTVLPRPGDVTWTDPKTGKNYYVYKLPSINGGTTTIAPNTNVILLPTAGSGTSAISLSGGKDGMIVGDNSTLQIYTPADISITGNASLENENGSAQTSSIQIYGTNTSSSHPGQSIKVAGNGVLTCTTYAPNASIEAKGGGNSGAIYGAFVGYSITLTGNDSFHYDESLRLQGNTGTYQPSLWIELTKPADRALYDSHF